MSNIWKKLLPNDRRNPLVKKLFSFLELNINLPEFITVLLESYNLGKLQDSRIIIAGYQDLNLKLTTTKGKYFIKIFSPPPPFIPPKRNSCGQTCG